MSPCDEIQDRILELGTPDASLSAHLSECENCRHFAAVQRSLDEQLRTAYTVPQLPSHFRSDLHARIQADKRRRLADLLPALITLAAALLTGSICAMIWPAMASYAMIAAVGLSAASYFAQIVFTWLTEELGEG
jgi:hypothetical protein